MLFVAAIASHLEGKVHVGLSSGLNPVTPEHFEAGIMHHVRNLSRDRAALFAKFGVPARFQNWEYLSPHGTLVFSTPEYIRQPIPDGVTLVGPARSSFIRGDEVGFPWDQLPIDGTPILYVSFGSQINYQPALFEKIIRVASKLPVFTVLSAGPLAVRYQNQKNLLAVAYAPQRELLKRTSVFISHGGANSVMEALGEGVSLLVHPLSSDQPLQARFLTEAEAGERIDLETMSDSDLANAIQRSLARVAVPRLAEITASYQAADGVKTAADFLEASLTGAESRYDSEKLI
ncbi:MAG: glycosyltransferase [Proteobacteria bacterium]|nr:MAG: glycosyltransferase [Pseudomonadota bacterium]